jgi:hypothetical protein
VFPSCTDAEPGLIEIVIVGGGAFVPGLVVDPVQEVKPTIARITQTRFEDVNREAAALIVFSVPVRAIIGFTGSWKDYPMCGEGQLLAGGTDLAQRAKGTDTSSEGFRGDVNRPRELK